jgi:16S rRNA (guanine527-N7)-methyltransferase
MEHLTEAARALGVELTAQQQAAFELYYEQLVEWNEKFNLTAITGYEEVQTRHFLDSLSCLLAEEVRRALGQTGARVIDVGSGAGFPGIPLKLLYPHVQLTLLEATGKKVIFLKHLVRQLGLEQAEAIHARAEELGRDPSHRESYDLALVRAVAELAVAAEYALPLCRVGGWAVALKGEAGEAEAQAARPAIALLGGGQSRLVPVDLPGLPGERCLVIIQKDRPTPPAYPRRPGLPARRRLATE